MTAQKLILGFLLSAGLSMSAHSAYAHSAGGPLDFLLGPQHEAPSNKGDTGAAAPELAGHGAPAALALVAAGAAIVISRRRRPA